MNNTKKPLSGAEAGCLITSIAKDTAKMDRMTVSGGLSVSSTLFAPSNASGTTGATGPWGPLSTFRDQKMSREEMSKAVADKNFERQAQDVEARK